MARTGGPSAVGSEAIACDLQSDSSEGRPRRRLETPAQWRHPGREPAVRRKLNRLQHDAEDERRRDVGILPRNLTARDPRVHDRAHRIDRGGRAGGELSELAVLNEQQEPEQLWVLVVRYAKAPNHRGHLSVRGGLGGGERVEALGERNVVPLEQQPDQLILAVEVPIERPFRDIDRAGDVSNARLGYALLGKEPDCGSLDVRSGAAVGRAPGASGMLDVAHVSKRLLT